MIVLTTSAVQVVPVGGTISFDSVVTQGEKCQCHRYMSSNTKLLKRGFHLINFSGNIGSDTPTTEASVTIRDSGDNIRGATAVSTTEAAGDLNNVSVMTIVNNCCGNFGMISVANTGTTPLNVGAGATLVIAEIGG